MFGRKCFALRGQREQRTGRGDETRKGGEPTWSILRGWWSPWPRFFFFFLLFSALAARCFIALRGITSRPGRKTIETMGSRYYSQPRIYILYSKRLRNGSRACGIRTADIASASYRFTLSARKATEDDNPLTRSVLHSSPLLLLPLFLPLFPFSVFVFELHRSRDTGARARVIHSDAWHGKISFSFLSLFFGGGDFISVIVTLLHEQIANFLRRKYHGGNLEFFRN